METTNPSTSEKLMSYPARRHFQAALLLGALSSAGCGPTFDPASLVETTRVLGARVTAGGDTAGTPEAPSRATPLPGEAASVTWLVTGPTTPGTQGWAFALCQPVLSGDLTCGGVPYSVYQGNDPRPIVPMMMPDAAALGTATSVLLYGRICDGAAPTFDPAFDPAQPSQGDPGTRLPGCAGGAAGTTAAVSIGVGGADTVNHNPTADRGITFDGQPWPAPDAAADPCAVGPMVTAGTKDHLVDLVTAGLDRESYTTQFGDPPVPTTYREALQISPFATRGKFQNAFAFVDADDPSDAPPAKTKWDAPDAKEVAVPTPVMFTFVVRDDRGGTDWTTRTACVTP